MKKFIILFFIISGCSKEIQRISNIENKIIIPKKYHVKKTKNIIKIDGKDDENDWRIAELSDDFIDIEGVKKPYQKTYLKMLWDDQFLYIYATMEEKHVWGDIKERDMVIYHNNDFEVFIDPDGDTYNYGEIEINALGTEWDLLLDKPYRLGGKANSKWDIKGLKSSVHVNGTINNYKDTDQNWNVEMAIPLKEISSLKKDDDEIPNHGDIWRINFSRVQWEFVIQNGKYQRKKINDKLYPENNWVWSNQGKINMHIPENWGFLIFTDYKKSFNEDEKNILDVEVKQTAYAIFREVMFGDLNYLRKMNPSTEIKFETIKLNGKELISNFKKTKKDFEIEVREKANFNRSYIIKQNGVLQNQF